MRRVSGGNNDQARDVCVAGDGSRRDVGCAGADSGARRGIPRDAGMWKALLAQDPGRAAIRVKLTGSEGTYERPVHMPVRSGIVGQEVGKAKVDGDKIAITGGWRGEKSSYEASYSGTFVRRSAKLSGQQSWMHEGKSYTRTCSGAITRPLAAFLPKPQKPAQ